MTESTRTVLKVVQQAYTVTRKGVIQKLNDMGMIRILKKNEITTKIFVKKSEKVTLHNVILLRKVYSRITTNFKFQTGLFGRNLF